MTRGIIFDLDDTLVDTEALRDLRRRGRWRDAVGLLARTSVYPGVAEVIAEVSKSRIPWAVVTTSVSFYAERVLTHHRLGRPPLVAFHDAPRKPSPAPVVLALSRLGLDASNVVGVGDAETDLIAYRAAGVQAVGAGWSGVLHQGDWDSLLEHPLDVLRLLNRGS